MKKALSILIMMLGASTLAPGQDESVRPVPLQDVPRRWQRTWIELTAAPSWVSRPEQRPAQFVFVTCTSANNMRRARASACDRAPDHVRDQMLFHLEPALGHRLALEVTAAVAADCRLLELAVYPGAPGSRQAHAAMRWTTPSLALLKQFDPALRSRIDWVVRQPWVRWQRVDKRPNWADVVPSRPGRFRMVFLAKERTVHKARLQATALARGSMRQALLELLEPVLGSARAERRWRPAWIAWFPWNARSERGSGVCERRRRSRPGRCGRFRSATSCSLPPRSFVLRWSPFYASMVARRCGNPGALLGRIRRSRAMMRAFSIVLSCVGIPGVMAQRWMPEPVPLADLQTEWTVQWIEHEQKPAWVDRPEQRRGQFVFVSQETGKSPEGAASRGLARASTAIQDLLLEHLGAALGSKNANAFVFRVRDRCRLVEVVTYPSARVEDVSVAALAWAVPLEQAMQPFEADIRGRIEWLLLRPLARWQFVEQQPAWTEDVPTRAGHFRMVVGVHGRTLPEVQSKIRGLVRPTMRETMHQLLAPMLGAKRAKIAIDAGLDRIVPVRRAHSNKLGPEAPTDANWIGWSMWEVSIEKIAQAAPAIERHAVRSILEQHGR